VPHTRGKLIFKKDILEPRISKPSQGFNIIRFPTITMARNRL